MWAQLFVSLVLMIVSEAIQMAISSKQTVQEPEAGKMDVPLAEEGNPLAVVFGTVIIKQPQVGWYGDPNVQEIKSKSGGKK